MLVQEKVHKEGNHLTNRINELGLKLDEWKILDWNPMYAIIFYESDGLHWDEQADVEGAGLKGKWMGPKPSTVARPPTADAAKRSPQHGSP